MYRKQKYQDVDLNLSSLKSLNSLAKAMMSEVSQRNLEAHLEQAILSDHVMENNDTIAMIDSPHKEKFQQNYKNHHHLYDNTSSPSTMHTNQASSHSLIDTALSS